MEQLDRVPQFQAANADKMLKGRPKGRLKIVQSARVGGGMLMPDAKGSQ
jgi:hypothetical protein